MRADFLVAAFVVCANAVPVAEPIAATPVGYGPQTVTVTVNAQPTVKTVTSTMKTSSKKSTVTVGPVATSRKTTSTKPTTSTKKSTTSTKKTSTSTKKSTTSTKKSTTSTKAATTVAAPKTTSTTSKKTTSTTKATTSTTKATTSTTKATTSTSASGATPTTLDQIVVYHHNLHRSNHSAPNIKWSSSLASIAAEIAATCVYEHSTDVGGGGYGQNIAAGVKANNISEVITDLFYNGEMPYFNDLYGQSQPSYANFAHWGHFSQIVWKDTTTVGCAVQYCPNGLANAGSGIPPYFTVCNYEPAGNYGGEYADNIGRPLGHAVAHWNTGL